MSNVILSQGYNLRNVVYFKVARFEVSMVVKIKVKVFWCSVEVGYQS
jgi:hypothetical protein